MPHPDRVIELLQSAPPTLGSSRLLCIDGPSGAGKTTLASQVAAKTDATLIGFDSLLNGWRGSFDEAAEALVQTLLLPLADGRPGWHRHYDWGSHSWGTPTPVDPAGLLILEGVGSGSQLLAPWRTLLAWVDAPSQVRRARALTRAHDGAAFAPLWGFWSTKEAEYFAAHQPALHAGIRLHTDQDPGAELND